MLYRWLLPIVAMLSLLGGSLATFAAAGVIGESECCCPSPDTCRCHDHDGEPQPAAELKKCSGEAELVAPTLVAAVLPERAFAPALWVARPVAHEQIPIPADRSERPETPPF